MVSWRGLGEVGECLTGEDSVMVSVYVQHHHGSMPPRGLTRASRRVLLKTGAWSVVIIVLAFFLIYTILLLCVDRPSHPAWSDRAALPSSPDARGRPKVRLRGKGVISGNDPVLESPPRLREGKIVWDPGLFDDPASQSPACRQGSLFVIIVTSSPDHFEHRTAIRNTWCSAKRSNSLDSGWHCLFLIGQAGDSDLNDKVRSESLKFGDVLRGSYMDSYRNLTHKVMHALTWVSRNCHPQFVLKTDDDCFVNAFVFRHFLLHHNTQTTNLYAGNLLMNKNRRKVIRGPTEKWSVPERDYSPEYYPVYASGSGYAFSLDVVKKVVDRSRFLTPIPNEDAYVGIVVDSLGVEPTFSGRFSLSSAGLRTCNYLYIFLTHGVRPTAQEELQRMAEAAQTECRDEEVVTTWF